MIVIKNALILQHDPPSVDGIADIVIDGNTIIDVGADYGKAYKPREVIDADGAIVTPGLVCSHNHFYSALARGIIADIKPSTNFVAQLQNLWWKLDRALDEESIYLSGMVAALDAVRSGTTSVVDHHASPSFISGSLSLLKKAFEEVGLRGVLCYETTDRNGKEGMRKGIKENVSFAYEIDSGGNKQGGIQLIEAAIGAHAPFTLDNATLEELASAVNETKRGIHIHVAEDAYDASFSSHQYGIDITERLEQFDLLNEKALLIHGVHLTCDDIERLNAHGSFLIHNPRSNMNNHVGYTSFLHKIENAAIGTDGIGSDMFEEMKFAYFKHKDAGGGKWPGDYLKILSRGNRILCRYFGERFGRIEKGCTADLVLYDYNPPTPLKGENIAGHMAFGLSSRDVRTVIINGNPVYKDRRFTESLNNRLGEIYKRAQSAAQKLWDRMNTL